MAVQREGEDEGGQKDVAQQRREASEQGQAPREANCETAMAKGEWERNLRVVKRKNYHSPPFSP